MSGTPVDPTINQNAATSTQPVPSTIPSTGPTQTSSAAAAAAAGGGGGSIGTMAQLKAESPKLYKAMMEGIAVQICNNSQRSNQRVKEMMQEARSEDQ